MATYQRAMIELLHDVMYKEMGVNADDMIAKSIAEEDNFVDLKKIFEIAKEA